MVFLWFPMIFRNIVRAKHLSLQSFAGQGSALQDRVSAKASSQVCPLRWSSTFFDGKPTWGGAKSWEIFGGMLWFYMLLDDLYSWFYMDLYLWILIWFLDGLFIWFLYGLSWEIDRNTSKWSGKHIGKLAKIIQNHPSSWWWSMGKKTTWGSHISGNLHTYAQETVKKPSNRVRLCGFHRNPVAFYTYFAGCNSVLNGLV